MTKILGIALALAALVGCVSEPEVGEEAAPAGEEAAPAPAEATATSALSTWCSDFTCPTTGQVFTGRLGSSPNQAEARRACDNACSPAQCTGALYRCP